MSCPFLGTARRCGSASLDRLRTYQRRQNTTTIKVIRNAVRMAEAHKAAKTSCLITWSLVKELIAFLTVQFGDEIDWEFSKSRSRNEGVGENGAVTGAAW